MMADTATNIHHDHFPDLWGAFGDGLEDPNPYLHLPACPIARGSAD
jgi:hypothetical protein